MPMRVRVGRRPAGSTGRGKGKDKDKGTNCEDQDEYSDTDFLAELRMKVARLKKTVGLPPEEADASDNPLQLKAIIRGLLAFKKAGIMVGAPPPSRGAG